MILYINKIIRDKHLERIYRIDESLSNLHLIKLESISKNTIQMNYEIKQIAIYHQRIYLLKH